MSKLATLIHNGELVDNTQYTKGDTVRDVINSYLDKFEPVWIVEKPEKYEQNSHEFYHHFLSQYKSVKSLTFIAEIPGVGLALSPKFSDVDEGLNESLKRMSLDPSVIDVKFNTQNVEQIQHILLGLLSGVE